MKTDSHLERSLCGLYAFRLQFGAFNRKVCCSSNDRSETRECDCAFVGAALNCVPLSLQSEWSVPFRGCIAQNHNIVGIRSANALTLYWLQGSRETMTAYSSLLALLLRRKTIVGVPWPAAPFDLRDVGNVSCFRLSGLTSPFDKTPFERRSASGVGDSRQGYGLCAPY